MALSALFDERVSGLYRHIAHGQLQTNELTQLLRRKVTFGAYNSLVFFLMMPFQI